MNRTVGNLIGFWGIQTSSMDWCEPNYVYSAYVAEMANTLSSIAFTFFGIFGFFYAVKSKYPLHLIYSFVALSIVGIGSILFHATLTHLGQAADVRFF